MTPINIPTDVFFGFIFASISLGVFCFARSPQIPAGMLFSGMFVLTISAVTGNLIDGYSSTNPYPSTSQSLPASSVTVYSDSDTRVIDSGTFGIYNTRILQGETFPTGSIYIGKTFSCISVPMEKVGSPKGIAYFGVFNNSTHPTTEPKRYVGTIDVTTVTTSWLTYKLCLPANDSYTIQNNDLVGVLYENATNGNTLQLLRSFNNDIGTTNGYVTFASCWDCNYGVFQITHQIMQLTSENTHMVNTLPAPTEIDFPFTNVTKLLFSVLGVVFMLVGAIMGLRNGDSEGLYSF